MKNPLDSRRDVKLVAMKMETAQGDLDNSLQVLMSQHGPGTAGEYSADALERHRVDLRSKAVEPLLDEFDVVTTAAKVTLEHSGDFSRAGVLRKAQVIPEGKPGDDPTVVELRRLNANFELDRKSRAITAASDADLAGRYAEQAVKDHDLPLASLLLDEGRRRGDLVGMQVRRTIDTLPLPQVDEDTEHLPLLEREIKDLEADLLFLRTGTENTRHQMNATLARQQQQREAG
jgi:hypothetical protein